MRLVKINYRNPALDTQFCYCINNYLWNKEKVQIINGGKELLAPKYYKPRHVGQLENDRRLAAKYKARKPLKFIKKAHAEQVEKQRKKAGRKKGSKTDRKYTFKVAVNATEYKMLWNFLYKDVRDPLKEKIRVQTIEEILEKQRKENNNDTKS